MKLGIGYWTLQDTGNKYLTDCIGNELEVVYIICRIVAEVNENLSSKWINPAKVNENEIYVEFCEYYGNEQDGWK